MATRLKKLRINRVDVCDRGANQHAMIALYKRHEPVTKDAMESDYTPQTVNQILAQRDAKEAWWELTGALEMSVRSIMECADPSEAADLLTQTVNEFSMQARKLLPDMTVSKAWLEAVDEVEKAGRVIAGQRLTRIKDAIAVLQQIVREAEPGDKEEKMADADVAKRAEAAEAEATALKKQLAEVEAKLAKGDPEVLAKQLADMKKDAEQALAVAKRAQDRLEEREYIEKAQRYSALPIKPEEDWKVLKGLDSLEPSVRDRALELLGAAEGQLALAGALTTVGSGGERRGGTTAWDEAQGLAKALVAKSADLSLNDAITQVWQTHPALYQRYRKEMQRRD